MIEDRAKMFRRISPKKISIEIIEQFMDMLSKGQLAPGDELPPEREMAEMIGVSRPPLREALNALQAMGFIEIKPRSKITVKSITQRTFEEPLSLLLEGDIEKIFELLEIRKAMEGWAAYMAAERATEHDILKLESIIRRDQENLGKKLDDAKTDADFHVALSMATHNTIQSHLMATWYNLLWNSQRLSREKIFRKKGNRKKIAQQHLSIFEAIQRHDKQGASRAAREHIQFVEDELKKILEEESARP
jgi:GntR family transcriptional repressor for pyruvate dehydrogenase complex